MANRLAEQVKADAVVWDVGKIGASKNHIQAWEWLADSGQEWGVILEDDVIPSPNFDQNLNMAIRYCPTPIMSLYLGRGGSPHWQPSVSAVITQDVSFLTAPVLLSAQGYAVHKSILARHAGFRRCAFHHPRPIDESLSYWASTRYRNLHFSYCRRSLVDHRDGPTLIADHGDGQGRNGKTRLWTKDCDPKGKDLPEVRKAWLMANRETDWSLGSVAIPSV
jgi:hypothetical protein